MKAINHDVRAAIRKAKIYQYQVATQLGVNEVTFIRWLRKPLDNRLRDRVFKAIEKVQAKGAMTNEAGH